MENTGSMLVHQRGVEKGGVILLVYFELKVKES
jgi:hypothetical protein